MNIPAARQVPTLRLAAFYFLFFAIAGAALPFLPVYLQSHGYDAADIGAMLAVGTATKILAPNLWAWWGDRQGTRMRVVRVGICGALVTFSLLLIVDNSFWVLAITLASYNFFWNGVLPQFEVITLQHLAAAEANYGKIRLWGSVGFVLAVLAVGAATESFGIALLVPVVVALIVLLAVASMSITDPPATVPSASAANPLSQLSNVLSDPGVRAFLFAIALMQASHGPYYTFFTIHLESLGHTRTFVSVLWVLGVVAEVALFAIAPALLARFALRQLFIVCFVVTAMRWLMMGLAPDSLLTLIAAQLLHAVSFGLFHATAIQIVKTRFGGAVQGSGQALYSAVGFGIGGALGTYTAGVLWSAFGPLVSYSAAASAAFIAALVLWRWMK